jgi:glucosamine-phosphate N-acetyltransferase
MMKTTLLTCNDILSHKDVYFTILSHLTKAPLLSDEEIQALYDNALSGGSNFFWCRDDEWELVGLSTLLIEHKFARGGVQCGHIEDVVVRPGYEGKGIWSILIQACCDHAEQSGCYKVILDCDAKNQIFYEKNGFRVNGLEMRKDM